MSHGGGPPLGISQSKRVYKAKRVMIFMGADSVREAVENGEGDV